MYYKPRVEKNNCNACQSYTYYISPRLSHSSKVFDLFFPRRIVFTLAYMNKRLLKKADDNNVKLH